LPSGDDFTGPLVVVRLLIAGAISLSSLAQGIGRGVAS